MNLAAASAKTCRQGPQIEPSRGIAMVFCRNPTVVLALHAHDVWELMGLGDYKCMCLF